MRSTRMMTTNMDPAVAEDRHWTASLSMEKVSSEMGRPSVRKKAEKVARRRREKSGRGRSGQSNRKEFCKRCRV